MEITHRGPFDAGDEALSGAWFERGRLADGRSVVLKHLPPEGDWLTRATGGGDRAQHLWSSGLLDRMAATILHPVLDVRREDDHDVVVMEDVGAHLLPVDRAFTTHELTEVLAGMAAMHAAWEEADLEGLCAPGDRHRVLSPNFHRVDDGPHLCPRRDELLGGWELFAEHAPADVAEVVHAVHADPGTLQQRLLTSAPATFLHGDLKPANLGLRDGCLLAVDWGELATRGPAEMDLTWFASTSTTPSMTTGACKLGGTPGDVFGRYEQQSARPLHPAALDAACIGMFAQFGFLLTAMAHLPELFPEGAGARGTQLLGWWTARVREACERWSPA
jgi:hypothetical protein